LAGYKSRIRRRFSSRRLFLRDHGNVRDLQKSADLPWDDAVPIKNNKKPAHRGWIEHEGI